MSWVSIVVFPHLFIQVSFAELPPIERAEDYGLWPWESIFLQEGGA